MSFDLYSPRVLELAADIPHAGSSGLVLDPLARPGGVVGRSHKVSKLCGSEVSVELVLAEDRIVDFLIDPKACALGQASASVLARNIIGATASEVIAGRDSLKAMLKQGAKPPEGRFWELRYLESVRDYPPRHTSTLLAFEAAIEAIQQAVDSGTETVPQQVVTN